MSIEEEKENLEYGLPSHEDMQRQGKPVKFGTAPFIYQIDGNEWGNIPNDWTLKEATSVAVNSIDEIIVFNRGTKPIMIFDIDGNLLSCLLYTSPSPRDRTRSRMPSSA